MSDVPFRLLRAFNQPELNAIVSNRSKVDRRAKLHFAGDTLQEKLVRALAEDRAISIKEMAESFEFFAATRKHMHVTRLADVCAGHGLTGILFAAFERRIESVQLIDQKQPDLHRRIWDATRRVAPWIEDKVVYIERNLKRVGEVEPGYGVIAVHACGALTDRAISAALGSGERLAALPCCHAASQTTAPAAPCRQAFKSRFTISPKTWDRSRCPTTRCWSGNRAPPSVMS